MKINGRLIYLAGVVIVVLSVLLYFGSVSETAYISTLVFILGYFFGNERAFTKTRKSEELSASSTSPTTSEK